jgi:hypothetical protein
MQKSPKYISEFLAEERICTIRSARAVTRDGALRTATTVTKSPLERRDRLARSRR